MVLFCADFGSTPSAVLAACGASFSNSRPGQLAALRPLAAGLTAFPPRTVQMALHCCYCFSSATYFAQLG